MRLSSIYVFTLRVIGGCMNQYINEEWMYGWIDGQTDILHEHVIIWYREEQRTER